jgi:hypothetical protein
MVKQSGEPNFGKARLGVHVLRVGNDVSYG